MIPVSCGHEKGIGLEVFLKAFMVLSKEERQFFKLHVSQDALKATAKALKFPISFTAGSANIAGADLACHFLAPSKAPLSTASLESCLDGINPGDVLFTLPTSKDQLLLDGGPTGGHTDYFRRRFKLDDVVMCFQSPTHFMALASDHWSLASVASKLDAKTLTARARSAILGHREHMGPVEELVLTGINPHAGEGGLLGHEDEVVRRTMAELAKEFPGIALVGPVSGDALYSYHKRGAPQILMAMYHDQGLAYFKGLNRSLGANISFGLPFLRLSVDHGTAFDLYGKNQADYGGCLYTIRVALDAHRRQNPKPAK